MSKLKGTSKNSFLLRTAAISVSIVIVTKAIFRGSHNCYECRDGINYFARSIVKDNWADPTAKRSGCLH
jgi:hypothetical protein